MSRRALLQVAVCLSVIVHVSCQYATGITCGNITAQINGLDVKLTSEIRIAITNFDANFDQLQKKISNMTPRPPLVTGNLLAEKHISLYADCAELLAHRTDCTESGIYNISMGGDKSLEVYCDMTTDGGGWMVFQRRQNGLVNFTRTWKEYAAGFGDVRKEFWIGNDNLHILTRRKYYKLRVDLEDKNGTKPYAEYNTFLVASEEDKYRVSFNGYIGTAGDALANHNGNYFSTIDRDNDKDTRNCALTYRGGWWFNACLNANLNGQYNNTGNAQGIIWYHWRNSYTNSLKFAEMKIKPMFP